MMHDDGRQRVEEVDLVDDRRLHVRTAVSREQLLRSERGRPERDLAGYARLAGIVQDAGEAQTLHRLHPQPKLLADPDRVLHDLPGVSLSRTLVPSQRRRERLDGRRVVVADAREERRTPERGPAVGREALEQGSVLSRVALAVAAGDEQPAHVELAVSQLDGGERPVLQRAGGRDAARTRDDAQLLEGRRLQVAPGDHAQQMVDIRRGDRRLDDHVRAVAPPPVENHAGHSELECGADLSHEQPAHTLSVGLTTQRRGERVELRVAGHGALDGDPLGFALQRDRDELREAGESRETLVVERDRVLVEPQLEHAHGALG